MTLKKIIPTIKPNLAYAFGMFFLIFLLETFYRALTSHLNVLLPFKEYFGLFVIFFMISYISTRSSSYIISIFLFFFFLQMSNCNYFGYFVFPIEIYLFFTKQREILETVPTVLGMGVIPLISVILCWFIARLINKKSQHRKTSKFAAIILVLFLTVPVFKLAFNDERNQLGSRPNTEKTILKNSIYVTQYFIGKTLPRILFDINTVESWSQKEFSLQKQPLEKTNIVLIIGESLALNHMHLFGYERNTTPFIMNLKSRDTFLAKRTIAGGTFTDTAIPVLLNIAKKPDATEHIISNRTNLFRMAKTQGFSTYFISAQANDNFSYIRGYMGVNYIDKYVDPSFYTNDNYTSYQDSFLLDELKTIKFGEKRNFIVLNMTGSHEPYQSKYPPKYGIFGDTLLDQYDNSVYYTDYILSRIVSHIEANTQDKTLILFTSDHGQHVGENGYGKGNIEIPSDYEVPFIIYAVNSDIESNVKNFLGGEWVSHYDVSRVAAYYLGYDSLDKAVGEQEKKAYAIGGELNGNSGYVEITITNNGDLKRVLHY